MSPLSPEKIFVEIPDEYQGDPSQQDALLKNTLAARQQEDSAVFRGYIDYIDAARTRLGIVLLKIDDLPVSNDKSESGFGLGVYDLSLREVD